MIKHFNTAVSAGTTSGGSSKKGGGVGTFVVVALIAVVGYLAYNFIQKRNQIVVTQDED